MTSSHVQDVFLHMEWADARIWSAMLESDRARADPSVLETLHHIHETQHAFLSAWQHGTFRRQKMDEFETPMALYTWGNEFHAAVQPFIQGLTDASLDDEIVLPWAHYFTSELGREPGPTTIRETLYQLPSHSMHHRGQVARRLRELGETPPMMDYIVWVMGGRQSSASLLEP